MRVNYASYLGEKDLIADNPTLMLIRLLESIGIKRVAVAGFDGYSASAEDNYFDPSLALGSSIAVKMRKNELIRNEVKELRKTLDIGFLTESKYDGN